MYNFKTKYQSWPHHIQSEFRAMVVYEEQLCGYGTFFNWLSTGVPGGSKAIIRLDELVDHYQNRSDLYLGKQNKRNEVILKSKNV